MPASWSAVLGHLCRHGYLRGPAAGGERGASLAVGPLGRLLLRNLTAIWRRDVELGLRIPVVPAILDSERTSVPDQSLTDAVSELRAAQGSLLLRPPFGVTLERPLTGPLVSPDLLETTPPSDDATPPASGQLTLLLAVPPAAATDWYQTLQRRRRIWWRDLADDPGNYSLAQRSPDDAQVVFDGRLSVERLRSHGPQAIDGAGVGRSQQAHLLSCELSLQAALHAVCADALDGGALRLQEALAPFRRAVPSRHHWPEELRALAVHVSNQLRSAGVPVFPLPAAEMEEEEEKTRPVSELADGAQPTGVDSTVEDPWLEETLRRTDGAGVPLTVLLSERTLRDGVCGLRSRDTTLSQQVHVSQLTEVADVTSR